MKHPHPSCALLMLLSAAPAVLTFLVVLTVRWIAWQHYHDLSFAEAAGRVFVNLDHAVRLSGPLGVALIVINYVSSFGIIAVVTVLALRWFHWKRVACGYVVSVCVIIGLTGYLSLWRVAMWMVQTARLDETSNDHWATYWFSTQSVIVFVAMFIGAVTAWLPIFRPGSRAMLNRGTCPKCQYDLKGKVDEGCPECGWNRVGPTAGREARLLPLRESTRSTMLKLAAAWTLILLIAFGVGWLRYRESIPHTTAMSPHIQLTHPLSGAYSEVNIDLEIHSQSGWFGLPGKVSRLAWTATFLQQTAPPTFQPPTNPTSQAEIEAAFRGEFATIATLSGDQLAGGMMLHRGEDIDRFDGPIDVDTLIEVMQCLFPRVHVAVLTLEAEEILYYLTAALDDDVMVTPQGVPIARPTASVFGGQRGRYWGNPPPPSPTGSAIALVLGVFAAVWLYGLSVILRWGRRRLRRAAAITAPAGLAAAASEDRAARPGTDAPPAAHNR